jgi:hypothetical protein
MGDLIKHIFTDAAGRPEIKMILGIPLFLVAMVYGIFSRDWAGFAAMMGPALGLVGLTTLGDAAIDKGS